MLIEDVYTQVFPIGGQSKNEAFKVQLSPPSGTLTALVASALNSRDRGWRHELPSALADFFHECSQSLITFGEVVYEIVYFSNPEDHKVAKFELQKVRPFTIKRHRGQLVQIIPQEVVLQRKAPPFIPLREDHMLVFSLPAKLRRTLDTTLESLAVLSRKLMPEFAMRDFVHAASKYHYDSANQIQAQKLALAEAGKQIGWNARALLYDDLLEFYFFERQLRFERFKVVLRTLIRDTLNRGLHLIGEKMGFRAQLVVEGLPTISDVERAERDLKSGSKPFGKILAPFRFY